MGAFNQVKVKYSLDTLSTILANTPAMAPGASTVPIKGVGLNLKQVSG